MHGGDSIRVASDTYVSSSEPLVAGSGLEVRVRLADLDPARLRLLGLGDANLKDAVRIGRRDLRLVYALRQASGARESWQVDMAARISKIIDEDRDDTRARR